MKKQFKFVAFLMCVSVSLFSQVNVTGGSSATYSTVNAAFAAINAGTHTGTITIDITANTTEPTTPIPLMASGQGSANYTSIIMRPTVSATISGVMVTGRGVLEFDGVDNFFLNGDAPGGPINRDLSIFNDAANTVANTAAIRFIGRTTGGLGVTTTTIQNCIIYGSTPGNDGSSGSTVSTSYGIYAGSNAVTLSSGGTGNDYDDIVIRNNVFRRAYFGLYIGCLTGSTGDNLVINNNTFGSNTAGFTLSNRGISLNGVTNSTVQLNDVFNLKVNTSVTNAGIEISGTASGSVTISRNKVYEMASTSTGGWGCYGISLAGGNNHLVVNNVIYDIVTTNYLATSQTFNAFGIRLSSGTGHMIYYNSVNMFGNYNAGGTACAAAAFLVSSTTVTGLDIRNNIFNNKMTASTATTKKFMSVWFPASYNFLNAVLENNAYTITNDPDHFVGKIGTTTGTGEYANLSTWKAISQVNNPTNDVNSVPVSNGAAPFIADNNLTFTISTLTPIESGAVLIPGLGSNIDINAAVRPLAGTNPNTNPDMGAYEFDGVAGIATDAGVSAMLSPISGGCYGASENIVVTIKNYGTGPISNIPVTVTVSGAASQTTTGTYLGTLGVASTVNFTVGTVNMTASGVYSFNAATSLSGDTNTPNDAMTQETRTVNASVTLPQAVNFTGFTGANLTSVFPNWYEASGATTPTGTASLWTSQTGLNSTGNITARLNMFTTTRSEWIVGPKFTATSASQLSFDAAVTNFGSTTVGDVMGSDDMVRVMVSTDCGLTYSPIFTVSATNSLSTTFTNFVVSLAAYSGQNIIVAFLAQDGPVDDLEDYDFHLENINLYTASATDAGVTALTSPGTTGCYGAAENLVVQIKNYGTSPISNVPVTVTVSGVASQTTTGTYTGTIPVAGTVSFTVGTLNMLPAGTYSFDAASSLPGDGNATNDAMAQTTRVVTSTVTLPQTVDFTGFTGANLTTVFPNWYEASGVSTPSVATSLWLNQTGVVTATNVTARINLYTTNRNEWIVGPKFTASSASQISFDAAVTNWNSTTVSDVMGSDDKVRVMVSTDCGLTYSPIFTISATNSLSTTFTNFTIPLGSYAGQSIIVAFLAQDGPVDDLEDYDFHLDNINIYTTVPVDAGAQALVNPAAAGCYSANENMVIAIKNYGSGSISNVPVTVVVSGATTQTTTATYTGTIIGGGTANFTVGVVNMLTPGVYSFKAYTSLPSDLNLVNDTMAIATRTVVAPVSIPQTVDFTGFTGANLSTPFPNWYEATGATAPTGTTSLWLNQTNVNTSGNITARINLYTTTRNEWIVGPKIVPTASTQLSFDAAVTDWNSTTASDVMGSDDMVRVMVSTDCGLTYSPIYTVSATNSLTTTFTNFTIPLGAYAGQNIIVAFLAQDGPIDNVEDYDFHLDNINLYTPVATDAGAQMLVSPGTVGCYTANENMSVLIKNYGSAPISNVPVTIIVSGAITQTTTSTYTGTIPGGGTASFTVGVANMLTPGVYSFKAYTTLPGDLNLVNDTMPIATRTNVAPAALPQAVDFTGFTGANLTTVFPNWYEAAGATAPTGTTSLWLSQTGVVTATNVTARVNLYTTNRNEWIVGPKVTATSSTQLSFDAAVTDWNSTTASAVMGSDDKVRVMVSTDCGLSYSPVFTVSATNSLSTTFTNFIIPLGSYSGQDIIVAFLAQDGPVDDTEDYDFHLDNINLYSGSPTSTGPTVLGNSNLVAIYPNPVRDELTVFVSSVSKQMKLKLYNALGQLVLTSPIESNTTQISFPNLNQGVYIYRIEDNASVIKQGKLIKE